MAETYRGVVRGGTVVLLDERTSLPDDTVVLVTPMDPQPGTGAALVAALNAAPRVPAEWVEELERLIEGRQRPPVREDPFAEPGGSQESR
jgi:hypothetical protein